MNNELARQESPVTNTMISRIPQRLGKSLLFLFLALASSHVFAQAPWKSGILVDEFVYEKAPFPECHASTIAETSKGLVTAFFGGTKERNPDVCIWVCRQESGKWTAPQNVADGIQDEKLRYPTWNPVLYQVPGGDLLLFYKVGPSPSEWKGWMKSSADGGVTWSSAKALPDGFIGPVKNKPVLLSDGTLLSPTSTEGNKTGNSWQIHFERSGDFGKTWTKIPSLMSDKDVGGIQPSVLFHKNGKLQLLARSRNRAVLESWSSDNGKTWTPLAKTSLPNNNSGTDAVTMKDGRQVLVYNHVLPPGTEAKGSRTPLNLSVSVDGKNWQAALILEDSPISQYSYPSVIQTTDGLLHVVYTWRRERIKHVVIDPKKLKLKKITGVEWPALKGYIPPKTGEVTKN